MGSGVWGFGLIAQGLGTIGFGRLRMRDEGFRNKRFKRPYRTGSLIHGLVFQLRISSKVISTKYDYDWDNFMGTPIITLLTHSRL